MSKPKDRNLPAVPRADKKSSSMDRIRAATPANPLAERPRNMTAPTIVSATHLSCQRCWARLLLTRRLPASLAEPDLRNKAVLLNTASLDLSCPSPVWFYLIR